MDCGNNFLLCRPHTVLSTFLKINIALLLRSLHSTVRRRNIQRHYRDIVLSNTETQADHLNDFFNGNSNINTSPDVETSSELSAAYDAEYSGDERCELWYNDYNYPDPMDTFRDHDYYTARHNS